MYARDITTNRAKIEAKRFLSLVDDEVGAISYSITPLNFSGEIVAIPYLDFDVENEDIQDLLDSDVR